MGNLNLQTLPRPVRGNQYEIELHPDWEVWGPNGGYLSSILLRAVGLHANKDVPVSYCGHYLRVPAFGLAQITVDCVKDGKQAAAFQVQLRQSDNLMTQALVWVCNQGSGLSHQLLPKPTHWLPLEQAGPRPPAGKMRFWQNLEIRGVKNSDGHYSHWYRFAADMDWEDPFADAARSLILIDSMQWPARYYKDVTPPLYVAPSLDLYVQFHRFSPRSHWLFSDALSMSAAHGLVGGGAMVWNDEGQLLASGGSQSLLRAVASPY
jgi:acyl-CoA thioesterase-2